MREATLMTWQTDFDKMYSNARCEHAFLLRCEGLKLREIADHLGTGRQYARQLVCKYARRLNRAMTKTKVYVK